MHSVLSADAIAASCHRATGLSITVDATQDPSASELLPPALDVPVTTVVGSSVGDHDEVPGAGPHDVVAAGAPVLLLPDEVADLEALRDRPRRRVRALARPRRGL
jgi:hypothetical protein